MSATARAKLDELRERAEGMKVGILLDIAAGEVVELVDELLAAFEAAVVALEQLEQLWQEERGR